MDVTDSEHVVALCGSQREGGYTRLALERILAAAENRGATIDLVDYAGVDAYPETAAACAVPTAD